MKYLEDRDNILTWAIKIAEEASVKISRKGKTHETKTKN